MSRIDRDQALAWRARWEVVARHEIADLRATSVTRKMRQLEALFASRALFPEGPDDGREAEIVSERWQRIRNALRA